MIGRTNTGGGMPYKVGAISVYFGGTLCTCTSGTKVLKSKTTGVYTFLVPFVGTWTVSCEYNDGIIISREVTVSAADPIHTVDLRPTWIYHNGEMVDSGKTFTAYEYNASGSYFTPVTKPNVTFNDGYLTLWKHTKSVGTVFSNFKVNYANYSKLCMRMNSSLGNGCEVSSADLWSCAIVAASTEIKNNYTRENHLVFLGQNAQHGGVLTYDGILRVDYSSYTSEAYILFTLMSDYINASSTDSTYIDINIYDMWLEK